MSYQIKRTSKFKKDFKSICDRGLNVDAFKRVLQYLASGEPLPEKYLDHPLRNSKHFQNCRECHIEPDWLLVYQYDHDDLILYLIRTGSHSDLF